MNARQIVNLFVDQGMVDARVVDDILQEVASTGKTLATVLFDSQAVTEEGYYQVIAHAIGAEYVNLKEFAPPDEMVELVPASVAQLQRVFPLGYDDHVLQLAMCDPLNQQTLEDLRFTLGKDVRAVVAPVYQIEELIKKHYGSDSSDLDAILAELGGQIQFGSDKAELDAKALENEANSAPIIRYVELVLAQDAFQLEANTFHQPQ